MDTLSDMYFKAKNIVHKTPETITNGNVRDPKSRVQNKALPEVKPLTSDFKAITKSLFNKFWICCKESRIESPNSFYGCFYIGPFDESLSQTLAHNIRRTLLSELSGLAITAVEIEGVLHKFSNLPGIQETVLDILCNLQNVVLKKNLKLKKATILNAQTAYLRRRGPGVITVADIILPEGIQCVNPDQYIATLTEDGVLNMKIFINEGQNAIKQKQKNGSENMKNATAISDFGSAIRSNNKTNQLNSLANKIYLDSVFMPVTKVNTIIQNNNKCTDDIFENNMLFKKRVDSKPDYTLNDFTSTNTSGISLNTASTYKNSFFRADTVPAFNDRTQEPFGLFSSGFVFPAVDERKNKTIKSRENKLPEGKALDESFITLSEINKKQQNKQCHIIIEIWTNGSIHPREALYDCLGFLSKTFCTLENIKMLGSMFKSDLIYSQILNKNTKKLNPDIFNKKFMF